MGIIDGQLELLLIIFGTTNVLQIGKTRRPGKAQQSGGKTLKSRKEH